MFLTILNRNTEHEPLHITYPSYGGFQFNYGELKILRPSHFVVKLPNISNFPKFSYFKEHYTNFINTKSK